MTVDALMSSAPSHPVAANATGGGSDEFRMLDQSTRHIETQSEVTGVRKVVVGMLMSLDGVAEAPNTFFGWDDSVDASIPRLIATQDAVILGRRTFDEWVGFWPGSDVEPFAPFINGATKHVATSTPLDQEWANATVIDGELVEYIRDLKQQPGGDIGVHGSISVAQALLVANLVDELRLAIGR